MALATNTLIDGEWVTRTLDVNTVLRHYDQQDRDAATTLREVERAPKLGLLSQTVIRSPIVHWILPARLRDNSKSDVAFIGDDFVQIKELRCDGLLWDVTRKEDFGTRIRNARVVGSVKAYEQDPDVFAHSTKVGGEEVDDIAMSDDDGGPCNENAAVGKHLLPPQCLLLQLDTGDSVFLTLRQLKDNKFEFVSSRYRVSKPMLKLQPGMHLAVDPSSRYMIVGCSEGVFAIYSLHPRSSLAAQYMQTSSMKHVESETQIYPKGVILKMEFLYPTVDDEQHIILLVLAILNGKVRMLIYEWEAGSDLKKVTARSSKGYLLEKSRQVPLLLIPLTIKSSFILVYENSMAVCQGILHGTPKLIYFNKRVDKPTPFHHGLGIPLWTSWTRPARLESHKVTRDDLFIAREDGLVKFLEIDSEDDDVVTADNNIGELGANCGMALASLDYPRRNAKSGDLFIVGGDASSGGTYLLQARKNPVLTEPMPNWSPAHDFVTTYVSHASELPINIAATSHDIECIPKPDRIFVCVGKGSSGGITEFRHGYEANIGLEVDYESTIISAWALSPTFDIFTKADPQIFLLALGGRSVVLQLSGDATDIVELEEEATRLDLVHRTVTAITCGECIIQVTEKTIVVIDNNMNHEYQVEDLLLAKHTDASIEHAAVDDGRIFFTARFNGTATSKYLQILSLKLPEVNADVNSRPSAYIICQIDHDVSCITTGRIAGVIYAIAAGWSEEGLVTLTFQPSTGGTRTNVVAPSSSGHKPTRLDMLASIVFIPSVEGVFQLLCGTRKGMVGLFEVSEASFHIVASQFRRIGATPAMIVKEDFADPGNTFLVTCDLKGFRLSLEARQSPHPRGESFNINQIWLSDALKPSMSQPQINSIIKMRPSRPGTTNGTLLVVSGSQLLITGLSEQARPVTRHIAIGGTPTRLLYSHSMDILVVAVYKEGKSTLIFIDPATGEDISCPLDEKTKDTVRFVSGLGNSNERIFRLFEWSFTKDSKTWNFIIAATSTGRLLIISIEERRVSTNDERYLESSLLNGTKREIAYYTRHKFKSGDPVYSATGLSDGLLWCAGTKLVYDTLDLTEKKFKRMTDYELPSPATDLIYDNGTIYALTSRHSLEILKLISINSGEFRIVRTHGDQLARDSLHQLLLERSSQRPVHLISDKLSSIVGLWPTYNTKADTLEPVFEAALHSSILRFRLGQCRPIWDPMWPQGTNSPAPILTSNFQALGLSITGSLSHFTVLDLDTWRLLRLIMDLASRSPKICEFTYSEDPMPLDTMTEPKTMMHIDGDVLKTVLRRRGLNELLGIGSEIGDSRNILQRFLTLLHDAHHGRLDKDGTAAYYIAQAYRDLEFYLRPVM